MKREERSEYTYIKNNLKRGFYGADYGTLLTIRTDASTEYKQVLDSLYTEYGFHPGAIRVDAHYFDDKERIIYLFGRTWDCNGEERSWEELYSNEERANFAAALK